MDRQRWAGLIDRQRWAGLIDRQQSHRAETEQCQRVQVVRAPAQSPVQARRGRATRVSGEQLAQRRAGGDLLAGTYGRSDRLVGGSQPVGVPHGDHRSPGHQTGEEHGARTGASDHRSGRRGQVDAPVTGQPRPGRRVESAYRTRRPGDRPAEPPGGLRGGRQGRRDRHGRRRWFAGRRLDQPAELDDQREGKRGAEQPGMADRADARDGWGSHDGSLRPKPGRPPARPADLWTTGGPVDDHPVMPRICYGPVTTTARSSRSRSRTPRRGPTPSRSPSGRRRRGRRGSIPHERPRRW